MQVKPTWTHIEEYDVIVEKILNKYPDRFSHIDPKWIIAYGQDKARDAKKAKIYQMSGQSEPESFTNDKKYFIKYHLADWESLDSAAKNAHVFSALLRIDPEKPDSGKPLQNGYKDQDIMVSTFGPYWFNNDSLPDLLRDNVQFKDESEFARSEEESEAEGD